MRRRTFFQSALAALTLGFLPKQTKWTHEDGWKVHRGDLHLSEALVIEENEKIRIEGSLYSTAVPHAVVCKTNSSLVVDAIVHRPPGLEGFVIDNRGGDKLAICPHMPGDKVEPGDVLL